MIEKGKVQKRAGNKAQLGILASTRHQVHSFYIDHSRLQPVTGNREKERRKENIIALMNVRSSYTHLVPVQDAWNKALGRKGFLHQR